MLRDTLYAEVFLKEFEKAYAEIALIIEASFREAGWRSLTRKAEEHGIIRQEATNF